MKEYPAGVYISIMVFCSMMAWLYAAWYSRVAFIPLFIILGALWWKVQTQRWIKEA